MKNIQVQVQARLAATSKKEVANIHSEYTGPELEGFASAFGLYGKVVKGDGEATTSDFGLSVKPSAAIAAVKLMSKAGFKIEDQRKDDSYISFSSASVSGNFGFDGLKEGDCIMTVSKA